MTTTGRNPAVLIIDDLMSAEEQEEAKQKLLNMDFSKLELRVMALDEKMQIHISGFKSGPMDFMRTLTAIRDIQSDDLGTYVKPKKAQWKQERERMYRRK